MSILSAHKKNVLRALFVILPVLLTAVIAGPQSARAQTDTIRSLEVRLQFSGVEPPSALQDRIRNSLDVTGRKALEGKSIAEATQLRASLLDVLKKIFDEVLSGFVVDNIDLKIAPSSVLTVRLSAVGPMVRSVRADVELAQSIHPIWNQLFQQSADAIAERLSEMFAGVPVKSASWSTILLQRMVETLPDLSQTFPGFDFTVSVTVGETTLVDLSMRSKETPIRTVTTAIRSTTIPSLLLDDLKMRLSTQSEFMLGLPVEFARRKEAVLMRELTRVLEQTGHKKRLYLNYDVHLSIGRQTRVVVQAESTRFSGFLRGKVSLGKTARNPDVEGHYGIFVSPGTEIFSEVNFFPGPVEMQTNLGLGHRFAESFYLAAGRNVNEGLNRVWVSYQVSPDIILSWEKGVVEEKKEWIEGSVTYRAHEYFSVELVTDFRTDVWLRFVANL